jgi:hypothetical protein
MSLHKPFSHRDLCLPTYVNITLHSFYLSVYYNLHAQLRLSLKYGDVLHNMYIYDSLDPVF